MIVQPKTEHLAASPDTIKTVPSDWPAELFIECEVIAPPSAKGRTVDLRVPAEQIPALLKAVRATAIAARGAPMGQAERLQAENNQLRQRLEAAMDREAMRDG